ncbi:MAG TPA: AraD1 family protein [Acidobacteriaceae bacterium]|nr:AraD1 family protein [Acidobacteriaceae bacterium]
MRLVQVESLDNGRRVGLVEEPRVRLLRAFDSVYALAQAAIEGGGQLKALVASHLTDEALDYDEIYRGTGKWKLLPPIDFPGEPARCLVSGTGLTHLGSARDRQSMHLAKEEELTDSMRMFQWGIEAGRPQPGEIGIAPEWFYKGNGLMVHAHGEPLLVPSYAEDGGEEAEIAVLYVIGPEGQPYRVGMAPGNEFSDHRFEKRNYLNLAGSKLRTCSLGPELTIDPGFQSVQGKVRIERDGREFWSQPIATGEEQMSHSLANLEHHHFKFELHRRPGDVHIHFLGAHSLSFGQGIELRNGDIMEVQFNEFGRPLRNPLQTVAQKDELVEVRPLV